MTAGGRVLLAVADEPAGGGAAAIALASLRVHQDWLHEMGWQLRVHSYAEILAGIRAANAGALCLLHFPYRYWDAEIEGKLPDTYGTGRYGSLLREHLFVVRSALRRAVPHGLRYVNAPAAIALSRDKIALKKRLAAAGVPTPAAFAAPSPADVTRLLVAGRRLYVKAAHASLNKGIAVLTAERWRTNYSFDGERLGPGLPAAGGGWQFRDVDGDRAAFLSALCGCPGFLVEEAADAATSRDGERTELRVTVAGRQVLAAEVWSAPAAAVTTAEAEGGRRVAQLTGGDLCALPRAAADAALRATAAAGLEYAVHDIVLDGEQRPFVVDVQAFPALGISPALFGEMLGVLIAPRTAAASGHTGPFLSRAAERTEGLPC